MGTGFSEGPGATGQGTMVLNLKRVDSDQLQEINFSHLRVMKH